MVEIEINNEALLTLLQELIQINSVNLSLSQKGTGEGEIAQYIGGYLKKIGLDIRYQEVGKDRLNVIGILKGTGGGQSLMLNGHTDTVSVERMEINPFEPENKDGRIYGRGALDMKSGLAAQIMAVQSIIESGRTLKGDLILTFVADEEYASIGTEAVLKEYSANAAIICEPTNLDIIIAHKGFAWTKIEIFGRAAHGSLPEKGIDAIVKAGKVLTEIENLGENGLTQKKHPLLGSPSIHASLISGGIGLSTYPDYCKIELERRTLPGEDRKTMIEEMQTILQDTKSKDNQFKADFEVFFFRHAFEISQEQPIVKSLSRAYELVEVEKPEFKGMGGWIESALLAEVGIPTVIFGPSGEGAHASIEYVDFDSVVTTTEILIESIIDFCNG
jgi:acetylornithine deacetylase